MAKPLLMFSWSDVRDALETLAETSQQRRAARWLLERLKTSSDTLSPDELLVGDHQYGYPPRGIAGVRGWAPEPVRRLVWVCAIAAGLALAAGALIGSYDLLSTLNRIGTDTTSLTATGPATAALRR